MVAHSMIFLHEANSLWFSLWFLEEMRSRGGTSIGIELNVSHYTAMMCLVICEL